LIKERPDMQHAGRTILDEMSEGNRLVGRGKARWEDNIKVDLKEIRCEGVDWIQLVKERSKW
jgi:hypothetical protein